MSVAGEVGELINAGRFSEALPQAERFEALAKARAGTRSGLYGSALLYLGWANYGLANLEQAEGFLTRAIGTLEHVSGGRQAAQANDRVRGIAERLLGLVYNDQRRYPEAERAIARAFDIFKAISASRAEVAAVRQALALVYQNEGRYSQAEAAYKEIISDLQDSEFPTDLAAALDNLALLYQFQRRDREAEETFKRSIASYEKGRALDSSEAGNVLNNLAGLFWQQGRDDEAEALYRRVIAIYGENLGESHPDFALALNNLANVLEEESKLGEAERDYQRALTIRTARLGGEHTDVAQTLGNLASFYLHRGNRDKAEELSRRAVAIYEKSPAGSAPDLAEALLGLAAILQAEGKYDEAQSAAGRSLAIRNQLLDAHDPAVAMSMESLAGIARARGDPAAALEWSRKATALLVARSAADRSYDTERMDERTSTIDQHVDAFRQHLAILAESEHLKASPEPALLREAFEAAQWANQSNAAFAIQQMRQRFAAGTDKLASLVRQKQDLALLVRKLDKDLVDEVAKPPEQRKSTTMTSLRQQKAEADATLADVVGRLERGFPAYLALEAPMPLTSEETQKLLGVDEALVLLLPGDKETEVFALTRDAFDWKTIPLGADAIAEQVAAFRRGLSVEAASRGLARIECGEPEAARRGLSRVACGEAVTRECGDASARRGLARLDCIAAAAHVECSAEEAAARGVAGAQCGESVLKDCADAERRGLARADCDAMLGGRSNLFDLGRAHALYETLLGPVDGQIKGKPHLLIVPAGALTALPFHLLVTETPKAAPPPDEDDRAALFAPYRDAAWLIKRQAVAILPSVASLKALRVFARRDAASNPMVGFGDPVFNPLSERAPAGARTAQARSVATRSYTAFWKGASIDRAELAKDLRRLPDTADELERVAATVGAAASDIYLREAASETTVKRIRLSDFRIVYFATHGLVAGDVRGLAEPSLALSLPRQPSETDDGLLTASEIAQLKLNADWVVLSACNTVAGDKPGAEALSGLARAFFYAGARALLVSHWAVDSAAATRLTTTTFKLLSADPKLGRAEALRRAMLAYLADKSSPTRAYPAMWGPFEIVGEGAAR